MILTFFFASPIGMAGAKLALVSAPSEKVDRHLSLIGALFLERREGFFPH